MSSKKSSWRNNRYYVTELNLTIILLTNKKVLRCFLKVASDTVGSHRPGDREEELSPSVRTGLVC